MAGAATAVIGIGIAIGTIGIGTTAEIATDAVDVVQDVAGAASGRSTRSSPTST